MVADAVDDGRSGGIGILIGIELDVVPILGLLAGLVGLEILNALGNHGVQYSTEESNGKGGAGGDRGTLRCR